MSYAPPGESALELLEERINFVSPVVVSFLYAFTVILSGACLYRLCRDRKKRSKQPWFYIGYTTIMFIMGTLHTIFLTRSTQLEYVDDRNYPGGPLGFAENADTIPLFFTGDALFNITCCLADGLLLWRCIIVYTGSNLRRFLILPSLMYLATISMSAVQLAEVHKPNGLETSFRFSLPYFTLSLAENIVMSGSIVLRLLWMKRQNKILGESHGCPYTSMAAIVIESAALYAVFNLCFVVPYIVGHPIADIFLDMLGQIQIIAPLLIIYRVARGRAWSSKTITTFGHSTGFQFAGVAPSMKDGPTVGSRPTRSQSTTTRVASSTDTEKGFEQMTYDEEKEAEEADCER